MKRQRLETNSNPPVLVSYHKVNDKVEVGVIRDDVLVGGTKQRALSRVLPRRQARQFIYAGPKQGFAQVALAYCAKQCAKRSMIVVPDFEFSGFSSPSQVAWNFGAHIHVVNANLQAAFALACDIAKEQNRVHGPGYAEVLPLGFDTPDFCDALEAALRESLPKKWLQEKSSPKRLWLVAGSGTLLKVLSRILLRTTFLVVQVGKKIWSDQLPKNHELFIAPEKFCQPALTLPPFPSVATYDAKLWQFVLQHAQDGDWIWNVAKDLSENP